MVSRRRRREINIPPYLRSAYLERNKRIYGCFLKYFSY
jgi:hypothetical protein